MSFHFFSAIIFVQSHQMRAAYCGLPLVLPIRPRPPLVQFKVNDLKITICLPKQVGALLIINSSPHTWKVPT